jgi:hypothetical protein
MLGLFAAGVLTSAVPRWLAWTAFVLAIAEVTPYGFQASMRFLLWAAVAGIVPTLRTNTPAATPTRVDTDIARVGPA